AAAWGVGRIALSEEITEGVPLLIGAVLVGSLAFWMWRAGPHMKREVEGGMTRAAERGDAGRTAAVFLFAFGMVFREGLETAIFLSAVARNSPGPPNAFGACVGRALAPAPGVRGVRGALTVDWAG